MPVERRWCPLHEAKLHAVQSKYHFQDRFILVWVSNNSTQQPLSENNTSVCLPPIQTGIYSWCCIKQSHDADWQFATHNKPEIHANECAVRCRTYTRLIKQPSVYTSRCVTSVSALDDGRTNGTLTEAADLREDERKRQRDRAEEVGGGSVATACTTRLGQTHIRRDHAGSVFVFPGRRLSHAYYSIARCGPRVHPAAPSRGGALSFIGSAPADVAPSSGAWRHTRRVGFRRPIDRCMVWTPSRTSRFAGRIKLAPNCGLRTSVSSVLLATGKQACPHAAIATVGIGIRMLNWRITRRWTGWCCCRSVRFTRGQSIPWSRAASHR
jgi:hypothetical protein